MEKHYRIKEKVYESGHKEFIPQYKDGSVNGWKYSESNYVGKPIEDFPDELFWFEFKIWEGNSLVPRRFKTYDEAFTIIKKDKASISNDDLAGEVFVKEITHIIY